MSGNLSMQVTGQDPGCNSVFRIFPISSFSRLYYSFTHLLTHTMSSTISSNTGLYDESRSRSNEKKKERKKKSCSSV